MSAKKSRRGTKNPGHPIKARTSKATSIQKPRNKEAQSFDGPGYFLGEINRATIITLAYINATLSSNENKQAESMQAGHDFCMELRDLILRRMKEEPELLLPEHAAMATLELAHLFVEMVLGEKHGTQQIIQ